MTQRVARPMKFAAFISIIISVAVLFAACQGAVGPQGEKGEKGDKGDSAEVVEPPPAIVPLTGRIGPVLLDSLNAGEDENESTKFEIDLIADGYFNGGEGPYEFEIVGTPPEDFETAEFDEDSNTLVLKLVFAADGSTTFDGSFVPTEPNDYRDGFTVALSATDANGETAESSVTVKPNRAPSNADGVTDTSGVVGDSNGEILVGIQDGEIDGATTEGIQPRVASALSCEKFNECVLTLFRDDGDIELSVESDDDTKFSWSAEDGKLTLTGLVSTWNASATPDPAHAPVEVDVTATDDDGEERTLSFMLRVDAPPTVKDSASDLSTDVEFTMGQTTGLTLIAPTAAAALFEDTEGSTIEASYSSSNTSIIAVNDQGVVAPAGRGNAVITVKGTTGDGDDDTDGLGQFAEIKYNVTVK